jgi:hypothetical protein
MTSLIRGRESSTAEQRPRLAAPTLWQEFQTHTMPFNPPKPNCTRLVSALASPVVQPAPWPASPIWQVAGKYQVPTVAPPLVLSSQFMAALAPIPPVLLIVLVLDEPSVCPLNRGSPVSIQSPQSAEVILAPYGRDRDPRQSRGQQFFSFVH